MFHILATNHVGFTVRDMERGIALFTEVFGYEVLSLAPRKSPNVALLTGVEGAEILVCHMRHPRLVGLELVKYEKPEDTGRIEAPPCATGYTHVTFDVSDLDAVVERVAAFGMKPLGGISISTGGPNKGARAAYLRDGEGISIELIQPAMYVKP